MTRRSVASIALVCAVGAVCVGIPAGPAQAASGSAVISDCDSHARLTRRYSLGELRAALNTMPADVKEYTNCYDVIQRTLLSELGVRRSRSSGGSGGGSFLPAWLIVVLALLVVGAAGFGVVALRRPRGSPGPSELGS